MSHKTLDDAKLKAATDVLTQQHSIEFYALAFSSSPDKQGDIIAPEAADGWLERFYAAGRPLPVSFTHSAVRQPEDPFNIVGFAPADPMHVFKDEHGIRVVALLDTETNPTAAQVYSLARRGIVTGASVAYFTGVDDQELQPDGSTLIKKINDVLEAGPCLEPANDDAYLIAVKAMEDAQTKATDNSAWDGGRAMAACNSAADYRSICAGERSVGTPDERQHWALPHHYLGRGPNANGVRNALARLPQTEGLSNASRARAHLEAHMSSISPPARAASTTWDSTPDTRLVTFTEATDHEALGHLVEKAGRVISAVNRDRLLEMRGLIDELLAIGESKNGAASNGNGTANAEEPQANAEEQPRPDDDLRRALEALATAEAADPQP